MVRRSIYLIVGDMSVSCSLVYIHSWLQPDRAVNPNASELLLPTDPVITGISSIFTVNTRDQDGKLVHVDGMKVSSSVGF